MRRPELARPLRGAALRAGLAALSLGIGACDFYYYELPSPENLWHRIAVFDHMVLARYVWPYETARVPRYTIAGTVPISGGERDWSAEWIAGNIAAADSLKNPTRVEGPQPAAPGPDVPVLPSALDARGDTLYQTYCAVCHGTAGDAKGPVSPKVGAPSLLTARARAYSDGYINGIIRYGRGIMPRYGDKVYQARDRWAIVNHVRELQARAPAPPQSGTAAAPIRPGRSLTGSTGEVPR